MREIRRSRQHTTDTHAEATQRPVYGDSGRTAEEYAQAGATALKRKITPITGMVEKQDYRAMYKAAFAYHEQHNPPTVDHEYWKTHRPGEDAAPQVELDYWTQAARDIGEASKAFDGNLFFMGLLTEIYKELERAYIKIRGPGIFCNDVGDRE